MIGEGFRFFESSTSRVSRWIDRAGSCPTIEVTISDIRRRKIQDRSRFFKTCTDRNTRDDSSHSARILLSASILFANPLDLGGADVRRATRWRDRRMTARRVLSVSQWVHFSLPPGGVTRSRDHWVRLDSRALAYVRSIDRSVGWSRLPPTGNTSPIYIATIAILLHTDKHTHTHHDQDSLVDILF